MFSSLQSAVEGKMSKVGMMLGLVIGIALASILFLICYLLLIGVYEIIIMEASLEDFCIDIVEVQQLIQRVQVQMNSKDRAGLKVRESYTQCVNMLLQMSLKKDKKEEFQTMCRIVDLSFKKTLEVLRYCIQKAKQRFLFQKQNKNEEQEQRAAGLGNVLTDHNGRLVNEVRLGKKKIVIDQLYQNPRNYIERIKQDTEEKIGSLNTYLITNQLREVNDYFEFCKSNFANLLLDEERELYEIKKRSRENYQPTISMMEVWRSKLDTQFEELRGKLSLLERQSNKLALQNKRLKQLLQTYNKKTVEHATQTPGLYDYKLYELNQQSKQMHQESRRLFDLIVSYDKMLKAKEEWDMEEYRLIKDEMKRTIEVIRQLQYEKERIREECAMQKREAVEDSEEEQILPLFKQFKNMPAFQKQMYNSAVVKFLGVVKQMSHQSDKDASELVVTVGSGDLKFDIKMDKKLFMNLSAQEKINNTQLIKRRMSKISEFSMEKFLQKRESSRKRPDRQSVFTDDNLQTINEPTISRSSRESHLLESILESPLAHMNNSSAIALKRQNPRNKLTKYKPRYNSVQPKLLSSESRQKRQGKSKRQQLQTPRGREKSSIRGKRYSKPRVLNKRSRLTQQLPRMSTLIVNATQPQRTQPPVKRRETHSRVDHQRNSQRTISSISGAKSQLEDVCEITQVQDKKQGLKLFKNPLIGTPSAPSTNEVERGTDSCFEQLEKPSKEVVVGKSHIQTQTDPFDYVCAFCRRKRLSLADNKYLLEDIQESRTSTNGGGGKNHYEIKRFSNLKQPRWKVPKISSKSRDEASQSQARSETRESSFTVSKKLKQIVQKRNASRNQSIEIANTDLSIITSTFSTTRLSPINTPLRQSERDSIPKETPAPKLYEIKRNTHIKRFNRNIQKNFHSLIEDSMDWLTCPDEIRNSLDFNEDIGNCEVEKLIRKIQKVHSQTCKLAHCNHLVRFYQKLKRVFELTLPRKSMLPLKTLKIQQIERR